MLCKKTGYPHTDSLLVNYKFDLINLPGPGETGTCS